MRKTQRELKPAIYYVLNIYAGRQAKKHSSNDKEYITDRLKAHHKRCRSESYYVLTMYRKGKPIHKHKSSDNNYIMRKLK